jgi:hypothetical protein
LILACRETVAAYNTGALRRIAVALPESVADSKTETHNRGGADWPIN